MRWSRPDQVRIFFQPCHLRRARCWTWPIRFQRWEAVSQTRTSTGGAKEGYALDFVIPQNPVVGDVAWFSFVPDGTRYAFAPRPTDESVGYCLSPCRAGASPRRRGAMGGKKPQSFGTMSDITTQLVRDSISPLQPLCRPSGTSPHPKTLKIFAGGLPPHFYLRRGHRRILPLIPLRP